MEEKDFIFEDEEIATEGPFEVGSIVIINGEDFNITEFVKSKNVQDYLGFPAIYSWYKGKNSQNEEVNLFFFDEDIDSIEKNNSVSEKWWEESYRK